MTKLIILICLLFSPARQSTFVSSESLSPSEALYRDLGLEGTVPLDVFAKAAGGFYEIADRRRDVLTFIDFTKPSTEKRMWVIDMADHKVLFNTHVAHGRGSGDNYATSFSNVNGSNQSSLGFYLTGDTYIGKNGYSLLLDGLEAGINDKARDRAIVIHGAAYANPEIIATAGRLGRSLGCPALPEAVCKDVIDVIKEGSVLYIYGKQAQ